METRHRNSKKRQVILDAIRSTETHPSAEWIYSRLKPDYPDLSLATVYRNLRLFVDSGEIVYIGTVNGQERYDGCLSPHTHFVCTRCGDVCDVFDVQTDDREYGAVEAATGGRVLTHSLIFKGLCAKCVDDGVDCP